jgi:hypothetical protein
MASTHARRRLGPVPILWLALGLLFAAAAIAGVLALTSRDTPERVAGWMGQTSCAAVKTRDLDMRGADRAIGVERALALRADSVKLIDCEQAGGAMEYLHFGSVAELNAALDAVPPRRRICVHDAEILLNSYFFKPALLRTYCERLAGRIVEPTPARAEAHSVVSESVRAAVIWHVTEALPTSSSVSNGIEDSLSAEGEIGPDSLHAANFTSFVYELHADGRLRLPIPAGDPGLAHM